jgi:exodeoxyribonuclease III
LSIRIITFNLNGIRSAGRKGFFDWMIKQEADIICVQEIKAQEADLEAAIFRPEGYHCYFHCAEKKGYSGVGLYTKQEPKKISTGLGWTEADLEGRYLEADFGHFSVASLYMPSGSSGEHRQTIKYDFLDRYAKHLEQLEKASREYIICGDWNIAHKEIDLRNWKTNQKTSGFLPAERAWMDTLFGKLGFVDAFRLVNQNPDEYTFWSNRGQAWAKNVGWRIDYQVITPGLTDKVKMAAIYRDERFSDHAPLIMEYNISFDDKT